MTLDVIKNRIERINKVHEYINHAAPILRADIKARGYQVKSTEPELFKKDKDRLDGIIADIPYYLRSGLHVWFSYSKYSGVQLRVKDNYNQSELHGGGFGCAYYDRTIYLEGENEFQPLEIYDVEEQREAHKQARQMLEEAREPESKARSILYITEGR